MHDEMDFIPKFGYSGHNRDTFKGTAQKHKFKSTLGSNQVSHQIC